MNNKTCLLALAVMSFNTFAQSPTTTWRSDLVGDYLNPKVGSELKISEPEKGTRWYFNGFLKGGYHTSQTYHKYYSDVMFRVRGAKQLTDDYLLVADMRLDSKENHIRRNGQTINHYNGLDDNTLIDQYRVGIESLTYGAFLYGKYTANMVPFFTDMDNSVKGMYMSQGDGGGKNADKFMYKKQFDNNLFLYASYDQRSHIWGFDAGYQSADIYSRLPDSHGIYFSMHNGQPLLEIGSFNYIYGNVNPASDINSDTKYHRTTESLYTYSLSAYKQIALRQRFTFNASYSEKDTSDTTEVILKRGYAKKGLGFSAVAGYQLYPANGKGFSPLMLATYNDYSNSMVPHLQYWFSPKFKVWAAYSINSGQPDYTKIEVQYAF